MTKPDTDYRYLARQAVLQDAHFLRLTLSGSRRGESLPWLKVVVRPVMLKRRRVLQFSYFDGKKDVSRNAAGEEAAAALDELLSLPFPHLHVQTTSGDVHVRITKRGKVLLSRGKPSETCSQPDLSHDRSKRYPLTADRPDPFLQAIGIMGETGRVRASMQGKFHQVNEFLRLMEQVLPQPSAGDALGIVDCGCGNAYLTFAAYHYLNHLRDLPARVTGIDRNEEIIARCCQLRDSLGWEGLEFHVGRIAEFAPPRPPDLVLSLHACDTATDEAIAQGILWGSRVILAAPCCQHELQEQLSAAVMRPVLRHGILKERTADILTDAFRALALQIMGYRTEVVQFVSPEHTSKNLMIRATRESKPGDRALVREYQELKGFWGVKPAIETLLGDRFAALTEHRRRT